LRFLDETPHENARPRLLVHLVGKTRYLSCFTNLPRDLWPPVRSRWHKI
jgi:hypothetical protein